MKDKMIVVLILRHEMLFAHKNSTILFCEPEPTGPLLQRQALKAFVL